MELSIEKQGNINVVEVKGRLDTSNYMEFDNKLQELMTPGSFTLVDCTELDYVSSSGLRVLLQVARQLEERSGRIVLCSVQEPVRRIFEIAGFASLFHIYGSSQEAIQGCLSGD